MSLIKIITSNNGAVAKYHRIGRIDKNGSTLTVTVESYADEFYRNAEKEFLDFLDNRERLIAELSILSAKAQDDMTEQEVTRQNEIEEQFNRMSALATQGKCTLFETVITLNVMDMKDISFQDIYNRLKTNTEMFNGAEDCL